ncbi:MULTISPECIES: UDP-N-acetyl-D-mannosamine dehydrogenase [Schaalia]|uniref:UDP-N-acetyl-D-mannosamine dehydrogenase n=1 Tax=Schaalia TaxID=2529408 RepID=UPI0026F34BCA|nr:UDP-N-acetyl-D-mannosamine dehydrogenase [Schaalia hyovaginalis]MCI6411263.1 UDP-N-acetyl-D-mannosamine dehydrogenase [Schaalia hyovaginalis]MCI7512991.1 UDP-N-acetyl-D-mannosamine dehydrogenase [Schaalia hyovaginalis]MDY4491588.1 UDP-N-acetyl-D-mannosamine dehydrogenase [Schaalia hyovaginalis]
MFSSEPRGLRDRGRLSVVGLGYIGLPTAVAFARAGWSVRGVDVSTAVVETINEGRLPFAEEGLESALREVIDSGDFRAASAPEGAEVFIIAVPTPFGPDHEVDTRFILSAAASIAPVLEGGELIVLESTAPPGTTEVMAKAILEARPDLASGPDAADRGLLFAHAPERVLPGRIMVELVKNDRIVGGLTVEAGRRAREVYESFCEGTVSVTDAATAELVKLTENSFRDVNIAFANELSLICEDLGLDVWEVISLANRHPRVSILQPGPGVGGHCIAVDPWFIVSSDPERARLIRTAREVNDSKPFAVVNRVEDLIDVLGVSEATVGVLGLAFKPDIDDLRESPSVTIAQLLSDSDKVARVLAVEPNISNLPDALSGRSNVSLVDFDSARDGADVLVLLVDHKEFRAIAAESLNGIPVVDTKGLWRSGAAR